MDNKIKEAPAAPEVKTPRHVAIGTRHLVIQRDKIRGIINKANEELKSIEAALLALGYAEQLTLK